MVKRELVPIKAIGLAFVATIEHEHTCFDSGRAAGASRLYPDAKEASPAWLVGAHALLGSRSLFLASVEGFVAIIIWLQVRMSKIHDAEAM